MPLSIYIQRAKSTEHSAEWATLHTKLVVLHIITSSYLFISIFRFFSTFHASWISWRLSQHFLVVCFLDTGKKEERLVLYLTRSIHVGWHEWNGKFHPLATCWKTREKFLSPFVWKRCHASLNKITCVWWSSFISFLKEKKRDYPSLVKDKQMSGKMITAMWKGIERVKSRLLAFP